MKKYDLELLDRLLRQYHKETGSPEAQAMIQIILSPCRTAGRKPVYSEDIRRMIVNMHREGSSIRQISALTGCSVGFIHKTIHDSLKQEES